MYRHWQHVLPTSNRKKAELSLLHLKGTWGDPVPLKLLLNLQDIQIKGMCRPWALSCNPSGILLVDCCSWRDSQEPGQGQCERTAIKAGQGWVLTEALPAVLEEKHQTSPALASLGFNAFCFRAMILVPKHTREASQISSVPQTCLQYNDVFAASCSIWLNRKDFS